MIMGLAIVNIYTRTQMSDLHVVISTIHYKMIGKLTPLPALEWYVINI